MNITMNAKKGRKNNFENVSPTGHRKKFKNIVNAEDENNVTHKSLKKKENVDVMQVKVGRKRKQTDADIETPTPKKIRRKTKQQTNIEVLSLPSSTNNFDAKEIQINATPSKRTKKKTKIFDADKQAFHIVPEQNNISVNVGDIPIQQNGKRKERDKSNQQGGTPGKETSIHNVNDALICKEEVNYKNIINDIATKEESLRNDNVVNITVQELVETNSDLNNEIFAELEKNINKVENPNPKVAKIKETINWPKEDLKKLVDRMEACIPANDVLAFGTRAEKLEWDAVAFKNYTADECKKTWFLLQKEIRKFRLLKEVLVDAKQWIISPQPKSAKPRRHPDLPRKPLTAYFIYYMKKRDVLHQTHPGLDATEISKILGQEFKSLTAEKKLKYEKLAAKKREEYEQHLEEFYKTHPDVPRIVKMQKIRPEKPAKPEKLPKPPKPPKPVKEKPPPKERIPKRPHPPFQYYFLSELEKPSGETEDKIAFKELCKERWKEMNDKKKLVWINYAEAEYVKYKEALKQYLQSHPDFVHTPHKLMLSKEEIQIKERAAGKPSKPPVSAYNLYARMLLQSDEIKAIPVKNRLIYVSNQWKNCVEEEKKQYRELSAKLNEKYKLDFASYLETLPEEERKRELQKNLPRQRKSEEKIKKGVPRPRKRKKPERTERKSVVKKVVEPEQPPISAFKYFATLYTGEEPVAKAWKALSAEQKKIYEDELVKKKQAYIADFEKFLKSLSKEELEAFSNSRNKIKQEDGEDEEESSDESGTEDSETESNEQDDDEEDEDK